MGSLLTGGLLLYAGSRELKSYPLANDKKDHRQRKKRFSHQVLLRAVSLHLRDKPIVTREVWKYYPLNDYPS